MYYLHTHGRILYTLNLKATCDLKDEDIVKKCDKWVDDDLMARVILLRNMKDNLNLRNCDLLSPHHVDLPNPCPIILCMSFVFLTFFAC